MFQLITTASLNNDEGQFEESTETESPQYFVMVIWLIFANVLGGFLRLEKLRKELVRRIKMKLI